MCGRINIHSGPLTLLFMDMLGIAYGGDDRFNVAPTLNLPVFRVGTQSVLEAADMRWWLTPYWAKEVSTKYSMFNAKAETLAQSRAFREPYARRRCAVPIAGFYEWRRAAGGGKQPYYIHAADDTGLLLAGIWDRWRGPDTVVESFAIVTTAVHAELEFVHSRQPVMLSREEARRWLDPEVRRSTLDGLLASHLPGDLEIVPVSTYVNNARNEGARCMEPVGDPIVIPRSQ
jgi:putative SOS response-associated peptidase YedK